MVSSFRFSFLLCIAAMVEWSAMLVRHCLYLKPDTLILPPPYQVAEVLSVARDGSGAHIRFSFQLCTAAMVECYACWALPVPEAW